MHFLIYTNHHKDADFTYTNEICDYIVKNGHRYTSVTDKEGNVMPEDSIPTDADCMLVLGGDGSMLQAAWAVKNLDVPLIGVNLGTLGYMTEIEPQGIQEALDHLFAGEFITEERMMLKGEVLLTDGTHSKEWALNDIVITRVGSLQITKLRVYVNGQFLNEYLADGVIITTPTGSTGYSLSAGGPIVEPQARLIMLTPISPHTLNARSIILSPEDEIEIVVADGREGSQQTVEANFDGAHKVLLKTGDKVRIVASRRTTQIAKINCESFLEVLHRKISE